MKKINSIMYFFLVLFSSCLENRIAPELSIETESAIVILVYLNRKAITLVVIA